ncbi:MAG: VWA domain-containing protein [Deltaproteobacteria bacterium]|nr:VWA domain-containing protein [Deltaproteobacteria bacterium]
MSLDLERHAAALAWLGPEALELVRASWPQACQAFGAAGLEAYLAGLRAAAPPGTPFGPLAAYVRAAPDIAEAVGPRAVERLAALVSALGGQLPPERLERVLSASAVAARRLGDPQRFAAYLELLRECAALDPTVLAMVLDRLDFLLSRLTVTGLRRWVIRGLRANPHDLERRHAYFGLKSQEAAEALAAEGEGTLFVLVQRQLELLLRALSRQPPRLRAALGSHPLDGDPRPSLEATLLRLPDAFPAVGRVPGSDMYRAAVAHALAHLRFSPARQPVGRLRPMAIAVASLVEDARVEQLLLQEYPGLRRLWGPFHTAVPDGDRTFDALTRRLARALLDPGYQDGNYWVNKGRTLFARQASLGDYGAFRQIASVLANDLGQMRVRFNERTHVVEPAYRDDNRYLWAFPDPSAEEEPAEGDLTEAIHPELDPGGSPLERQVGVPPAEEEERGSEAALLAVAPVTESIAPPVKYPEWDYLISAERPAWCTVIEKRAPCAPEAVVDGILQRHRVLVGQIRSLVRGVQVNKPLRLRRQQEGDLLDLDAAVSAIVSLRTAQAPDPRVHVKVGRRSRDLAVLVLLDVSESTNDRVGGTFQSVLDLSREATALLADAMNQIGDAFAIHAFASNGRHEVEYYRLKDFDRPYDSAARQHLAGIGGQLSTRIGPALRHAGQLLRHRRSARKLVLLLTDGEPSDVDVQDPHYLRADAKKAVEANARDGIHTFCMSLDRRADDYVERIFGPRNYMVVDHISRLPEQLPKLYVRVTHGWS